MKPTYMILSYLSHFLLEWEMFRKSVVEKIKIHIFRSIFFSRKSCRLWDKVEKYFTAGQAADDNATHAHCMLDTQGCKYTHSGCVILIASPLQQWLHERAPMLRYTHIACIVINTATCRSRSARELQLWNFCFTGCSCCVDCHSMQCADTYGWCREITSARSKYLRTLILTFWRQNYFFLILAHPVYKMWIIQEPNS